MQEMKWNWVLENLNELPNRQYSGKATGLHVASGDLSSETREDACIEALEKAKSKLDFDLNLWKESVSDWEIQTSQTSVVYLTYDMTLIQCSFKLYVKYWR